jgi:hypothetical protein
MIRRRSQDRFTDRPASIPYDRQVPTVTDDTGAVKMPTVRPGTGNLRRFVIDDPARQLRATGRIG